MPVSYPQHTSGFIPGFVPWFHTPSIPLVSYLVSYPDSYQFHTCFIPGFDTVYHTCGFMLVSYPVSYPVSYLWFHTCFMAYTRGL
eukprot:6580493-Heterocapsa_arctica.AAC.1